MFRYRHNRNVNREAGQASMVTVAMFMILFSVVAVSFTYIVVANARQTTNDSLQAAAKAAAESGVEDAKRLLVYCYNHVNDSSLSSADQDMCNNYVVGRYENDNNNNSNKYECNSLLSKLYISSVKGEFEGIEKDNTSYRVPVSNENDESSGDENEYYQCLKIYTKSATYADTVSSGKSKVVPLKLVNSAGETTNPATIVIKWHKTLDTADGAVTKLGTGTSTSLPTALEWSDGNKPAVIRVEQVGASKTGSVSIDTLVQNDVALTLRPSSSGDNKFTTNDYKSKYNSTSDTATIGANNLYTSGSTPIVANKCYKDGEATSSINVGGSTTVGYGDYACMVALSGALNIIDNDYYLRINAIYKNAQFEIRAYDASGNELLFDGVQPVVDVTGKSADSFSRIQARLSPQYSDDSSTSWYPEYAIETDGKVCKDMNVYYDDGTDNCN